MAKGNGEFCNQVEYLDPRLGEIGRRDFRFRLGVGIGGVALSSLLHQDGLLADATSGHPLMAKLPHRPAKAKSCIFLFMAGGPSQMDTFDPKTQLTKYHGTPAYDGAQ